jgi:hypothetical protein
MNIYAVSVEKITVLKLLAQAELASDAFVKAVTVCIARWKRERKIVIRKVDVRCVESIYEDNSFNFEE